LLVARGVRGFGDGFAAIVLPAYLVAIGFGTVEIGIVAAASLLGSALLTLGVGVVAPRAERRRAVVDHHRLLHRHDQSVERRYRPDDTARAHHAGAQRYRPRAHQGVRAL
jgi:hypothetical protein